MSYPPPNISLQRFKDYSDNPLVQALTRFITQLSRPLESVTSWGVEVTEKPTRTFHVAFMDGTRISGVLEEVWQVRVFDWHFPEEEETHEHKREDVSTSDADCP